MALATSTVVALAAMAAATAANQYNTNKTLNRQDAEQADGIRRQSDIQKRTDDKVNDEVDSLEKSTAADERAARMTDYMKTLGTARGKTEEGLDNVGLGDAFNAAGDKAKGDLATTGNRTAGLLSGIDAAGLQRQGEAFSFGNLATDISLLGRESAGQQFLTDLRTRSIRRNPYIDGGAAILNGIGQGMAGGGGAGTAGAGMTNLAQNPQLVAAMRGRSGTGPY